MNVFAKFDEIPSMTLQDIKETKRYRHTFVCSFVRSFVRSDNVKTVYPPTNTVCGGYKNIQISPLRQKKIANFHFSHYKSMGTISCHSNQNSYLTGIKT